MQIPHICVESRQLLGNGRHNLHNAILVSSSIGKSLQHCHLLRTTQESGLPGRPLSEEGHHCYLMSRLR